MYLRECDSLKSLNNWMWNVKCELQEYVKQVGC